MKYSKENINDIMAVIDIPSSHILSVFQYGSRVYGTHTEDSDWDFVFVCSACGHGEHTRQFIVGDLNITCYELDMFLKMLKDHHVTAMECFYLPDEFIWRNNIAYRVEFNSQILRSAFSSVASNSWVKGKKKFIVDKDYNPYIGKKSIFHSLRLAIFGRQIAKDGKISNYTEANWIWNRINELPDDWPIIEEKLKPLRNMLLTEFRCYAPK